MTDKPKPFEIISTGGEIIAYGCMFDSGKCIMEWTGANKLIMIWGSIEELNVVASIMKSTIIFI